MSTAAVAAHPYEEFLAGQRRREVEWASNRAAKKAKVMASSRLPVSGGKDESLEENQTVILEEESGVIAETHNKGQENFCKVRRIVTCTAACFGGSD